MKLLRLLSSKMVIMLLMIIFGSFQTFVSTVLILQDDSPDEEALRGRAAKLLGVLLGI